MKPILLILMLIQKTIIFGLTWNSPTTLSSNLVNATEPVLCMDSGGNLLAMWIEGGLIKYSSQQLNGSWLLPCEDLGAVGASSLQAVLDSNGNATAIWVQENAIYTSSLTSGSNWSTPNQLSSIGASNPQVVVDMSGNVVAIWERSGAIESAILLFGGVWSSPSVLTSGPADSPELSIGGDLVVAVWHAVNSNIDTIYSASRTVTGSWNSPQIISSGLFNSVHPHLSVDLYGNALAVWFRYTLNGLAYSNVIVQSAFCPMGGSWGAPTDISNIGIMDPQYLSLVVNYNEGSVAVVLWNTSYYNGLFTISGRPYIKENWIGLQTDLVYNDPFGYDFDCVPANPSGYMCGIFLQSTSDGLGMQINTSVVNTFSAFVNVSSTVTISQGNINRYPCIAATAMNDQILIGAAWLSYDDGVSSIQVCNGLQNVIQTPINLSVVQSNNDFGIFQEYYNILTWEDPPSQSYDGFVIFKNGELVFSGPSNVHQYIERNCVQNGSVVYGVAYFISNGDQSGISTITYP